MPDLSNSTDPAQPKPTGQSDTIFRKDALNNLSSPEQLDQLMIVTRPRAWISLFGIGIVLCGVVVWAFLARIPTTINGVGILTREGGVYQIVSPSTGTIRDLKTLNSGSKVTEGDVIGHIDQPLLQFQLDELRSRLEKAKKSSPDSDQLEQRLRELEFVYQLKTQIVSPVDGTIVEKKTTQGEFVEAGTSILSLESDKKNLEAVVYIPILMGGKSLFPGIKAQISPVTLDKSLYGYLEGEVASVSQFPSSEQEMLLVLGNKNLVALDNDRGPPYAIRVKIKKDDTSKNGYAWSSPNGKAAEVSSGVLANIKFVLKEQAPISLLFPSLGDR